MSKVLLIEDDPLIVNIYSTYLKNQGHEVKAVTEGSDALKIALDFKPQVIILDLMIPKMGGTKILEELRAHDFFKKTPILVYTNLSSKEKEKEVRSKGATEFLAKIDTNPKEVAAKIKHYLAE